MTNPFESPTVQPVNRGQIHQESNNAGSRKTHVLSLLTFVFPFLFPIALYASWLLGWAHLGHMPRPMLDDPKSLGPIVKTSCFVAGVLMMMAPGLLLMGILAQLFTNAASWLHRVGKATLLLMIWAAVIILLRYDFGNVCEWFID